MRLIDADALIRQIRYRTADIIFRGEQTMLTGKDSCNPAEWTRGYEQGVMDTVNMMGLQKVIEAEPVRHGEWRMFRDECVLLAECSECGTVQSGIAAAQWDYCPLCGAKMDGDDHDQA